MSHGGGFARTYDVRWADLDPNGHVRHTAYGDYTVDVRVRFLAAHGFPPSGFVERGFGPVLLSDQARYRREVRIGDTVTVGMRLVGLSPDGSHWRIEHEVARGDGKVAAVLTVEGGWLDHQTRRLTVPPPELLAALRAAADSAGVEQLPTLLRGPRPGAQP